jgi:hypothetical protein
MAYAADHDHIATYPLPECDAAAARPGILRRVFEAIARSHQRRADLEIGRFIARSGGRLTDDNERELMRRLSVSCFGDSA